MVIAWIIATVGIFAVSSSVGKKTASDFTLPGTEGRDYTLSDYRGQPVVLVFYPGDNTPVCTKQLNQYTSDIAEFEAVGARVLAIGGAELV